ncbi:hypothetical protein ABPG72_022504 [Tetrahymena utriculariae]
MEVEQMSTVNQQIQHDQQRFVIKNIDFIQIKYPHYADLSVIAERDFFLALTTFNQQKGFITAIFLIDSQKMVDEQVDQFLFEFELQVERLYTIIKLVLKEIENQFNDQLFFNKKYILHEEGILNNQEEFIQFPENIQQIHLIEYDLYPKVFTCDQIKNFQNKQFNHDELQIGVYQYVKNLIIDKRQKKQYYEHEDFQRISQQIRKCQNLEQLVVHLIEYKIILEDLESLASAFSECKNLKILCLYLSENNIGKKCFSHILHCLEKLQKITRLELNIRNNPVEKDSFIGIGRVIRQLKYLENIQLNLSNTGIDSENLEILAQCISENKNINSILFSAYKSNFDRNMLEILMNKFGKLNLENFNLYLSQNKLIHSDFEIFNQNIQNFRNLKFLKLCLSGVDNTDGLTDFALSIGQLANLNILKLYFRNNSICSKEISEVGKNISKLADLKQLALVLKKNDFSKPFLEQFANDLSQCQQLESLKLNFNFCKLDQNDLVLFTNSLKQLMKLRHLKLKLKENEIHKQQLVNLFQNLQKISALSQLQIKLSLDHIDKEGIENMVEQIILINNLRRLNLRLINYPNSQEDFLVIGEKIRQSKNILILQLSIRNIEKLIVSKLSKKISKARRIVECYVKSW